ncbi:Transcriptional regulatory protein DegU [compost metagenome]
MIQVMIVDDDPLICESMKMILGLNEHIQVTGTAANGLEAVSLVRSGVPADVVLMDIRMPGCDGVEGTRLMKEVAPDSKVLILTTFDDDEFIIEALRNGARGYLLKNISPERIIQGIRTVHDGDMLIHPDIARKLTELLRTPSPAHHGQSMEWSTEYGLTPTEDQVVALIAEGMTNKEIAQHLYLSEGTIKNYVTDILGKLHLRDRTQIAIMYWKQQQSR